MYIDDISAPSFGNIYVIATVSSADITVMYIPFNFDDISENLLTIPCMLANDAILASLEILSTLNPHEFEVDKSY